MVQDYEENYKPVPTPRTYKPVPAPKTYKPVPAPRTYKPVSAPRIIVKEVNKALKGYTKSYEVSIFKHLHDERGLINPLIQVQKSRLPIAHTIKKQVDEMKGLKFNETLKVTFSKMSGGEIVIKTAYFNSKAQTIINHTEITPTLKFSEQLILNKVSEWISEGSGWTIDSIDNHYLNIVKYKPMNGSSYIQLPIELRNSGKGLINLKNKDNECFRWCHIRHLNPQEKYPQRIKKSDKQNITDLDYSGIEFPVTIKQFNKIEKQNRINISVFGYEDKQPFPIYVSKEKFEDHVELLLLTKDENKHYVLIKDFNKFMFNQTKHEHRKHFCTYCLQCFSSERVLNNHKDNCIQVNGTQAIQMPEKGKKYIKVRKLQKTTTCPVCDLCRL